MLKRANLLVILCLQHVVQTFGAVNQNALNESSVNMYWVLD